MTIAFSNRLIFFLGGLGLIVIAGCYVATQPTISVNHGTGWDGRYYFELASQFARHLPLMGRKPFVYRLGLPWLVGWLFPENLLVGFWILNELFSFCLLICFIVFLKATGLRPFTIGIVTLFFIGNPWGPVRFSAYYPANVDAPALFFFSLFFALMTRRRSFTPGTVALVSLITLGGVFFREILLVTAVAFLFVRKNGATAGAVPSRFPALAHLGGRRVLPLCLGVLGTIVAHEMVVVTPSAFSFGKVALINIVVSLKDPLRLVMASFNAYGPVLGLAGVGLTLRWGHWRRERPEFLAFGLIVLFLSLIGGGDLERFALWAHPLVYLAIGEGLEHVWRALGKTGVAAIPFFTLLLLAQIMGQRLFWNLPPGSAELLSRGPEITLWAPYGSHVNLGQCWISYMDRATRHLIELQYLGLFVILGALAKGAVRRKNSQRHRPIGVA